MHKNNWTKASIALAVPLLARTYEKSAGAVPARDEGGAGRLANGGGVSRQNSHRIKVSNPGAGIFNDRARLKVKGCDFPMKAQTKDAITNIERLAEIKR